MIRFCALLILSASLSFGLTQNHASAQGAKLDASRPQFGSGVTVQNPRSAVARSAPLVAEAVPGAMSVQAGAVPAHPAATSTYADAAVSQSGIPQTDSPSALGFLPVTAADRDKPLGIGDIVSFSIAEDRDPPVTLSVTDTGELDFPYIGRVAARTRTCASVAAEVKRRLEADFYNRATVRLGIIRVNKASSLGKIYLSGLVHTPGPQDLYPGEKMTVSAAIVKAGGFAQFADTARVKITRRTKNGKTETMSADVGAVLKKGKLDHDIEVQDGDFIFVPQKLWNF